MLKTFQKKLSETPCELALFFENDSNLTYFTGVKAERACLAIPATGEALLFVPGFEAERFATTSLVNVVKTDKKLIETVAARFTAKNVGIAANAITYADAKKVQELFGAQLRNISDIVIAQRTVKSDDEIAKIKKACAITDELFSELINNAKKMKTELDAANFLKIKMLERGVEPSFPAIVATGMNAAVPHHEPTTTALKGFTVVDFGVVYKNYCSDMTRTIFVGTPTQKEKETYDKVRFVQQECISMCTTGNTLEKIHEHAKKHMGDLLIHYLGHSLGIDVHDVRPTPYVFSPNCVVTMEPGSYVSGKYGIRIEDDVVVGKKTPITLNKTPKQLLALNF